MFAVQMILHNRSSGLLIVFQHHDRTKHIDRRHFWIREMVEDGRVVVPYVRTDDNIADFLTKPLAWDRFVKLRDSIMNHDGSSHEH